MTQCDLGPQREGEELSPLMHGHEKSDPVIVAARMARSVLIRGDSG